MESFEINQELDLIKLIKANDVLLPDAVIKMLISAGLIHVAYKDIKAFIKRDIKPNFKDGFKQTNLDRMRKGLLPLDSTTGLPLEYISIKLDENYYYLELTTSEFNLLNLANCSAFNLSGENANHSYSFKKSMSDLLMKRAEITPLKPGIFK